MLRFSFEFAILFRKLHYPPLHGYIDHSTYLLKRRASAIQSHSLNGNQLMRRFLNMSAPFYVVFIPLSVLAQSITIATVPVGNPGNLADTAKMNDGTSGYGSVGYTYNIGEYDVTVGQYTAFLNAIAATDTYGLYNSNMANDLTVAGIAQIGSPGSYSYSTIGSPNHPITYVNWYDAARFVNWLNNDQPIGAEGPGTTETGSYTLNGTNPINVVRNANAHWVIPTENEWYKAAYYNSSSSSYYQYPFSSNSAPSSTKPGGTPNTANLVGNLGYAVTGSNNFVSNQNYLTDVGAYTASASPYGAFDMGGDVNQWNETLTSPLPVPQRGVRGGSWGASLNAPLSTLRNTNSGPFAENPGLGFRIALVPEPCNAVLACIAFCLLWTLRTRFSSVSC